MTLWHSNLPPTRGYPGTISGVKAVTTEHHIRWIQLYFHAEGDKFRYQVGSFEFTAHGEAVDGADKGPVYTHHSVTARVKIKKPGTLLATSLCNIHGLWENAKEIRLR